MRDFRAYRKARYRRAAFPRGWLAMGMISPSVKTTNQIKSPGGLASCVETEQRKPAGDSFSDTEGRSVTANRDAKPGAVIAESRGDLQKEFGI